jgi:ribosomal protein S12 methylthiotransferase accessory factor
VLGRSLADARDVLIAADWVLRRPAPGPLTIPGAMLSTGAAAGRDETDATRRALFELIERDAAALWWHGGRPARHVSTEQPCLADAQSTLAALRQGARLRRTSFFDLTSDVGIPVMAAVSSDAEGSSVAIGLGARARRSEAAEAALMELLQTETALQLALAKQAQLGDEALAAADRRHLDRARKVCVAHMPTYSAPDPPDLPAHDTEPARALAALGYDGYAVRRDHAGVAVVKAVAPDLQLLPGDLESDRLRRCRRAFGPSEVWTGGASLV